MGKHFLEDFLNPESIAIYGANNSGTGLGSVQLMNIILCGYKGTIYPIHLKLDSVLGYKAYKSIGEVPQIPDLVIIVLPPKVVPQVFKECGEKGVKYVILISGGFRELSGEKENTYTEQITQIPEVIYNLKELTLLAAADLVLTKISEKIGLLSKLKFLIIPNNKIKTLPESIGKLHNLIQLFLEHNELEVLPDSIGELENLYKLFLHHNNLKSLPESMENLTKLTELDLSYTPLEEVPEGILSLPNLKYLSLPSEEVILPKSYLKKVKKRKESEHDIWYIRKD
ncbi:MAG: hypothetical protein BAJALOKI2v1_70090 [Promethearchaeota archaeon]|nr:MAG: hypothetical protein BAJALOKI2v1_70090 [Candidatus Lokiarchaeota archaeon]